MKDLALLRQEAKLSMQGLVDRALVQDQVSRYKRDLLSRARISVFMSITFPIAYLMFSAFFYHGALHDGHSKGFSTFLTHHGTCYRKLYAEERYEKEKKIRPFESLMFQG